MAPRKICAIEKCPEKTHGRISDPDNNKRIDLCLHHFDTVLGIYGDRVTVLGEWGVRPAPIEEDEIDKTLELISTAKESNDV